MILVIALLILLYSTAAFELEVEDTATSRTANVWGSLLLVNYSLDNKLSLILKGAVSPTSHSIWAKWGNRP